MHAASATRGLSRMMRWMQDLDIPTQAGSLLASLGTALFGAVLRIENTTMLVVLGFMMILDLLAGLGKSFSRRKAGIDWFDESKLLAGTVHKILGFILVFACGAVDGVAQYVPGWSDFAQGVTPLTKLSLGTLMVGQFVSVLRNLAKAGVDAPVINTILKRLGVNDEESREIEAVKRPEGPK